jgi:tetratricopeptide (TPR) repeat protein
VPAKINLAMLHDQRGEKSEAERQFREVLRIEPELAEIHYSLGLLLAEDGSRLAEASESLAAAAGLSPDNPRIHYNLGLAYQRLDRPGDAEQELKRALGLSASDPLDCLTALAILYSQQKHWKEAALYADELIRLQPGNPEWKQFRDNLLRESEAGDKKQ